MTLLPEVDDIKLFPFADRVQARGKHELIHEEIYRSIPALNALADASVHLSKVLTLEARNNLFLAPEGMDLEVRHLSVELALNKRHDLEHAVADPAYMAGMQPASRQSYESAENDIWMKPAPPSAK